MMRKYRIDASCPMVMKGYSTGWPPIHVSVSRSATKIQNRHWLNGRNIMLLQDLKFKRAGTYPAGKGE